jgi:hypothetical protein
MIVGMLFGISPYLLTSLSLRPSQAPSREILDLGSCERRRCASSGRVARAKGHSSRGTDRGIAIWAAPSFLNPSCFSGDVSLSRANGKTNPVKFRIDAKFSMNEGCFLTNGRKLAIEARDPATLNFNF